MNRIEGCTIFGRLADVNMSTSHGESADLRTRLAGPPLARTQLNNECWIVINGTSVLHCKTLVVSSAALPRPLHPFVHRKRKTPTERSALVWSWTRH
jgi:hypothetical protein